MTEIFEKLVAAFTEPTALAIILLVIMGVCFILCIWTFVNSIRLSKFKKKLKDNTCEFEIHKKINDLEKLKSNESCSCKVCEEPVVMLEPEVTPEKVENEKEPICIEEPLSNETSEVEEKKPVKRDTTGMMKFSFAQLSAIAKGLGTTKAWKNKSEIVASIKLILNSEKCTKVQLIDTLTSCDFLGISPDSLKGLSNKTKSDLLTLLKNSLIRR